MPKAASNAKKSSKKKASAAASVDHFQISLYIAIALESLLFWSRFANTYAVPKVVAALVGAALVIPPCCIQIFRKRDASRRTLLVVFGAQLLAMVWATVNSMSPAVSFWGGDWRRMGLITQIAMMIVAVGAAVWVGNDFAKWKRMLALIAIVGTISAGYGLLQWVGWDPLIPSFMRNEIIAQFGGRYRAPGTIGQSTYFGHFLLYPFFAATALIVSAAHWRARIAWAGSLVTIAASLFFAAAARASALACMAAIVGLALWILSKRKASVAVAVILIAGLALGILARSRLENIGTDSESIGRIIVWNDFATRMLPRLWLTGTGPGMFRAGYARYRSPSYGLFGPDVHWETPHNVFLDRLAEQGVFGLFAFAAMLVVFAINVVVAVRGATDSRRSLAYAAFGAGGVAAVIGGFFNGEVIPTTYFLYLWVALSFALRSSSVASRNKRVPAWMLAASIALSLGALAHAIQHWQAESALRDGRAAASMNDYRGLLAAADEASQLLPRVGTYQLEFADLIHSFIQDNVARLTPDSRNQLAQAGIRSALWARDRTDKPMLALLHLVSLGDTASDPRTSTWLDELRQIDPQWFRSHELSARLLIRNRKVDEALKEATIAHQLAPYIDSSTNLWRQLVTVRRDLH